MYSRLLNSFLSIIFAISAITAYQYLTHTNTSSQVLPLNTATMSKSASAAFLSAVKARRSIYPLTKDLGSVTPARVQEIVNELTLHTPSSFNSQSNRVVVLFGDEHEKLWTITSEILKGIVPEDSWQPTADKMNMFKGAAGTVLFFDEQDTVQEFQNKYQPYADKFPTWATQSNAIQQHLTWTALELEGLGANLQHYTPLIDQRVASEWKLPASWKLNAQLVFGGVGAPAGEKSFKPIEERVKVFGA
jgi:predicted oxidoreductase (fatty acid repression mutant protein)